MPTVIDQFIVKLGLDPRDFTKGTKEAAAAQLDLEKQTQRSAERQSGYLGGLAAKWLTVTAAIVAIKKGVTLIDDVAERTRQLGIASKNYGVAANELRNFENAAEEAGGSAEEARKSIAGFSQALFNLSYKGEVSDSLMMLARLGVQFQDASGHARGFEAVVLDTADAIAEAQKQGMSRQDAFQYLQQAGFDQGTSQNIMEGRAAVQAALQRQQARRQVSGEDIDKATDIRKASIGKDQTMEGGKIAVMKFAGGIQESVNQFIDKLASPGGVNASLDGLAKSAKGLESSFDQFMSRARPKGRAAYESIIQREAARNKIPAEILAGVLDTESGFDPSAVNGKSGARGIAQLMPKYFPDAGKNPAHDIGTAAEYLADLEKQAGGNWDTALQMYNAGPTRVRNSMKDGGEPLAQETIDYPGKVMDYATTAQPTPAAQATAGGSTVNVDIDQITIQTRATDADGIAGDIDGAVQRKMFAAHAEQGMQ